MAIEFFYNDYIDIDDAVLKEGLYNELALLQALMNSTSDIFCIKDGEGKWLIANDEDIALFKLQGVDYRGKKDSELAEYSPFFYDAFLACEATDEQAWQKADIARGIEEIGLPSGDFRSFDVVKVPFFNEDGSRKNLVIIGRDNTELVRQQKIDQQLSVSYPDPFFILDIEGNFIDFHAPNSSFLYLKPEQFIGKNVIDVLPKEIAVSHLKAVERLLHYGGIQTVEYQMKTISGGEFFISRIVKIDEHRILSSIHDVTNYKRSNNELEQVKQTHVSILNSVKEAIYIFNKNLKIIYINYAASEMYGYNYKDFLGQSISFLSPEKVNNLAEVEAKLILAYEGQSQFFEFYGQDKKARIFPIEISASAVDYYGEKSIIVVGRDITERKQVELDLKVARDKALESDRLKSSFLATLTHELKTPLNAVIGFSELLYSESKEEFTRKYAKIIYDKGFDLLNIINDTLQMALIDAGEVEFRREEIYVKQFLDKLDITLSTLNRDEEVSLEREFPANINDLLLVTDNTKLMQVMLNLLRNALKFTVKGKVSYGVRVDESKDAYFFVEDTGKGIEEEAIDIIFQSFRQADETIARTHGGLGLGLAISKELVQLMGGELHVNSTVGKGSLFYFYLPGIMNL